jgi:uncharacterized protein
VTTLARRFLAGAAALLFAAAASAQDTVPVPKLEARVTDLAGTLAPEQRSALESKLAAFEQSRGSQVAVVIVPTIGSETIEEFAGRVADQWALGRKGVDDGVLFAVAMQERRMRIHTGRGVQGTLTDAASKRIVAEIVAPRFRERDFAGGIDAGVDAILRAIEGESLPAPAQKVDTLSSYGEFLVIGFMIVTVVSLVLRSMFGRFFGAVATSGIAGVAAWFIVGSIVFGLVAAFLAFLFTIFGGSGFGRSARGGGWGGYIPGGGWGGGGGSWGGGGGGGGFSGGGGGFDGGGASGSW